MRSILLGLLIVSTQALAAKRLISVTGHCDIEDSFDRYRVTVMLENQNMEQARATSLLEKRNNEALKKIKALKLSDLNLVTKEYGLTPVREWEKNKQVFKGYKARARVAIEFSDEKNLGKLLSTLSALKPDEITGPENFFSKEKEKELNNKCLVMALKDAKDKAQLMTKTLGTSIGKVHRIQEQAQTQHQPIPIYRAKSMAMSANMESAPQIEIGKSHFIKNVYVEFELD